MTDEAETLNAKKPKKTRVYTTTGTVCVFIECTHTGDWDDTATIAQAAENAISATLRRVEEVARVVNANVKNTQVRLRSDHCEVTFSVR